MALCYKYARQFCKELQVNIKNVNFNYKKMYKTIKQGKQRTCHKNVTKYYMDLGKENRKAERVIQQHENIIIGLIEK